MTADPLRELLRETLLRANIRSALAQPKLTDIDDFVSELEKDPDMRERIAAARAWIRPALAQQPEPVAIVFERDLGKDLQCVDGGDFKEVMVKELTTGVLKRGVKLYSVPPSAAALIAERDKEIAELKVGMKVLLNANSATAQWLKEKDAEIERLKRKEDAADMCLQSVSEARRVIKEHLGGNLAFLDDDLVRWVAKWQERTESAETRVGELEEKLAVLLAIQRIRIESAEESIALLRETRKKIPTPSQFIRVPDGKPFEPGPNGIQDIWGREPKVGESAGYQDVSYLPGNWSGKSTWRVQHMKWADNPEYAKAMELFARIDLLLSRDSETAPASPDPATAIPGQ
jgi:hypothetical protein